MERRHGAAEDFDMQKGMCHLNSCAEVATSSLKKHPSVSSWRF